jgi:hypothetical protein
MESRKFAVYNQTKQSTLSSSVTSVNAALEPLKVLKVLIEGLPAHSRTGLWLTNFKGVPVARTLSPFDLVYLDKENRVLHAVELSKDGEFAPFRGKPASALVLPSRSVSAAATREGDQLELRTAELEVEKTEVGETRGQPAPPSTWPGPVAATAPETIPQVVSEPSPSAHFFSSMPTAPAAHEPAKTPEFPAPLESGAGALRASVQAATPMPIAEPALRPDGSDLSAAEPMPAEPQPVESQITQDFFTPGLRSTRAVEEPNAAPVQPIAPSPQPQYRPPPPQEIPPSDPSLQISQPGPRGRVAPASSPAGPGTAAPAIQEAVEGHPHYPGYQPAPKRRYSWRVRLLRWLFPGLVIDEPQAPVDRRRADRQSLPGLVAYYFTGGKPEPQRIANISVTGFYLHTDERWMPGTVVRMTLQRAGTKGDDPADTISVNSRIVRWGSDGEGFEFILTDLGE